MRKYILPHIVLPSTDCYKFSILKSFISVFNLFTVTWHKQGTLQSYIEQSVVIKHWSTRLCRWTKSRLTFYILNNSTHFTLHTQNTIKLLLIGSNCTQPCYEKSSPSFTYTLNQDYNAHIKTTITYTPVYTTPLLDKQWNVKQHKSSLSAHCIDN